MHNAFIGWSPQGIGVSVGGLDLRDDRREVDPELTRDARLRGVVNEISFFDPAAKAAGLEDLSPYDLRHTAASLLLATGANVKAVQRMLGHASAAMTLDVNSGLFDDDLGALVERMDAAPRGLCHQSSRCIVWAPCGHGALSP
ncbi:tyrosine-type recombinase/integrase [Geodermatophilus sp. SYSU D00779]